MTFPRKILCVIVLLLAAVGTALAQGTVRGKVTDAANGETLIGATVRLEGTSHGALTDLDGKYTIPNVPKGVYKIVVSYISYTTQEFANAVIDNGQTVVLDVALKSDDEMLDEVVVTARANRESQNALLLEQKRALIATQAIGAMELSMKGISNAEAAVSQISGVSKNEGEKNVFIRGLADRYNATFLNGFPIPSDDPEYKNIALDIFDTDMIQSITVSKAFNAHQGGDVAGAIVDIQSKELVGDRVFELSASVGANTSIFGGKFMKQEGTSYFGHSRNQEPDASVFEGDDARVGIGYPIVGTLTPTRLHTPIDHGFGMTVGRRWEIADRHPLSVLLVANHGVGYSFSERIARVMDVTTGGVIGDLRGPKSDIETRQLVLLNALLELNKKHEIEYNMLLVHNNRQFVAQMDGTDAEVNQDPDYMVQLLRQQANNNLLVVNQLDSRWSLADKLKWGVGVSLNLMRAQEPDRKSFYLVHMLPGDPSESDYWKPAGSDRNDRFFSNLKENDLNVKTSLDWNFRDNSFVSIGYRGRFVNHRFGAREYNHNFIGISYREANLEKFDWDDTFSDKHMPRVENPGADTPYMLLKKGPEKWYESVKTLHSPYVELVYMISPRLTAQASLRTDIVRMEVQNGSNENLSDHSLIDKVYYLPSVNIKYDLNDKHALRLSGSTSYTLPQVKEISPFKYVHIGYASQGTPNLKPSELLNVDLKWDYYMSASELLSITAFYKEIRNPLARAYNANSASLHEYINPGDKADVAGIELEVKKDLINLYRMSSETRNKLSAGFNASYLYSNMLLRLDNVTPRWTTLEGASPWLLNGDLTYSYSKMDKHLSLSALMSYFSDRIVTYGTVGNKNDVIEQGMVRLDFVASLGLSDHFSIKLKANNLLDAPFRNTQKPNEGSVRDAAGNVVIDPAPVVMSEYRKGRSLSLSFSYKF